MKTIQMSRMPIRLSLVIIFFFGMVPAVSFCIFEFIELERKIQEGKNKRMVEIKKGLRLETKIDSHIFTSMQAMGEKRLERSVKSALESIFNLIEKIYSRHQPSMSPGEIADIIKDYLRLIRPFNGRGYFLIISLDGVLEFYPPDSALEGSDWIDIKDSTGKPFVREMIQMAKTEKEGRIKHTWPYPDQIDIDREKISFVRLFEPLGWVISIGDYLKAVEGEIQKEILVAKRQLSTLEGNMHFVLGAGGNLLAGFDSLPSDKIKKALADADPELLKSSGVSFQFPHLEKGKEEPVMMLAFARYYAPWGWITGKAKSLDVVENRVRMFQAELKEEVLEQFAAIFIVLLLAVFFVFRLGQYYSGRLKKSLSEFESFFEKAGEKKEQIDLEKIKFQELKSLGRTANTMVAQRVKAQEEIQVANHKLRNANARLSEMATIDGLTRVANRRHFDQTLEKEWARAVREKQCITLGLIDIDWFKFYNDTYGHQMGDDCLIRVATVLKESLLRPADLAARYGGEEFVLLLPGTDLQGGKAKAEQIQRRVKRLAIEHEKSPLGRVSFSMGLTSVFPRKGSAPKEIVAMADKALYRAKEKGRGRIECALDQEK